MKVVILAGGLGTRITEESHLKPKPMIEIGERPILWHIMKYYSEFGFNDFVICLGYKQYIVKEFFADYFLHTSDITIDLANNKMEVHNNYAEPWKVTLVHKNHKRIGTMTTVHIGQDKGVISLSEDGSIKSFREKSDNDGAIINGGFMVMSSKIFDFIDGDETIFEQEPLQALVDRGELMSFYHDGFWQCMDTQREKNKLEELWNSKKAPWKIWK